MRSSKRGCEAPSGSPSLEREVRPLRHASRLVVRELGFLQDRYDEAGVSHSEAHAMMELEAGSLNQGDLGKILRLDKSTTSRIVTRLVRSGFVRASKEAGDARRTTLTLTTAGKQRVGVCHGPANARVQAALATLDENERRTVLEGMNLYAEALRATRVLEEFQFRPIRKGDNAVLMRIIDDCLAEFGAGGPGFVNADPEFQRLYETYQKPRSAYFVVTRRGRVLGGGGVAPLAGGGRDVCEFQKMYLVKETRGLGVGQRILSMCISTARELGFRRCYLETLSGMKAARALYERNGFVRERGPIGATGHFGCDAYYARDL